MSDDKSKRGKADHSRIDVSEQYECRYWSEKFGVSADRLKEAVKKVGPRVDDVARAWQGRMNEHEECQAVLRMLRAALERRATPGTLAPRHRLIEEEAAALASAIEALADERDRMAEELKLAQAQTDSPTLAISS